MKSSNTISNFLNYQNWPQQNIPVLSQLIFGEWSSISEGGPFSVTEKMAIQVCVLWGSFQAISGFGVKLADGSRGMVPFRNKWHSEGTSMQSLPGWPYGPFCQVPRPCRSGCGCRLPPWRRRNGVRGSAGMCAGRCLAFPCTKGSKSRGHRVWFLEQLQFAGGFH